MTSLISKILVQSNNNDISGKDTRKTSSGGSANIKLLENTSRLERELEMHNLHMKIAMQKCELVELKIKNEKNFHDERMRILNKMSEQVDNENFRLSNL